MDILDMAKELGTMIAESYEMLRLKNAETALDSDEKAKTLMKEYKELQIELVKASRERKDHAVVNSAREKLLSKQKELNDYNITYEFLDAKTSFENFMKNVNDVISFAISGEESCSPGKCGSCGGCSSWR
jgi:cell fate (sporulation/competence/biofilm development) regulator YlbF (YheA/YmcA/DUF963 family)